MASTSSKRRETSTFDGDARGLRFRLASARTFVGFFFRLIATPSGEGLPARRAGYAGVLTSEATAYNVIA
ncbi:MAG: hypothetical protein ACTHU0_23340 [Kofleriaceae bacterium]